MNYQDGIILRLIFVLVIPIITMLLGNVVFATSFSVDKSTYQSGDKILLTGSVSPLEEGAFVSIQILNPSKSDFAQIDTFLPNSDGSFSREYKADGPKWNVDGTYTLKLFYNGKEIQNSFGFVVKKVAPKTEPKVDPKTEPKVDPKTEPKVDPKTGLTQTTRSYEPKTHIPGFPSLDKSPQYYIKRYQTESNYKEWFDSQFPGKLIEDVVGYKSTHVNNFPDKTKTPSYYIERYQTESNYKEWFDSQFPGKTIYQILGFPDPVPVPEWIKNIAGWWSTGDISDDDFVSGLQYMIENNIIIIPDIPDASDSQSKEVPDWIRNNANWWALDKISEKEFLNAIKYLIENGVIVVTQ